MFIEHEQNDARHGKKSDGNTYTGIWPEGSRKNQQTQNTDSKFSHHKICIRNAKMPTTRINKNIMLDTVYLSIIYLYIYVLINIYYLVKYSVIYLFIYLLIYFFICLFVYLFGKPNNARKNSCFNAYVIRHIQASEC
jgi:hypothetical protein